MFLVTKGTRLVKIRDRLNARKFKGADARIEAKNKI